MFPHNELRYYLFGLRAGLKNLFANGLRLGLKKSLGKIAQPINVPSRFAEYHVFETAIQAHLSAVPEERQVSVLDVGSPKTLGLYLGHTTRANLTLTDISHLNVDEYRVMWGALRAKAKGTVVFALQDARSLELPADSFDIVYSMSVVEHIDGEAGDSQSVREMLRVLKPGGLFVLSVPFGNAYMEQMRVGFAGASRKTGDEVAYFFQRIYDRQRFQQRILGQTGDLEQVTLTTVARRNLWLARAYGRLSESVRGALGFMNPVLSVVLSRTRAGLEDALPGDYGPLHSARDVYGDVILVGRKRK